MHSGADLRLRRGTGSKARFPLTVWLQHTILTMFCVCMCVCVYATECGHQEVAPGKEWVLSFPHGSKELNSSHGPPYLLSPLVGPDIQILGISISGCTLPPCAAKAGLESPSSSLLPPSAGVTGMHHHDLGGDPEPCTCWATNYPALCTSP